ncbi:MAG: DoxX family protein [Gloeobacteraceae cyanobacterium ES-bin-144]|nr:DoxX family protein [Verrucomicrobiales bacterium]
MKKFFFDCGTRDATASIGILVLRLLVGLMMLFGHGIPKIQNFEGILEKGFYQPDFIPFSLLSVKATLLLTIGAEVVASSLLVLGLMTRPAAFVFGFAMVVAAFGAHGADPWFSTGTGPAKELALMYLVPVVAIILSGAGGYSLDAAIYKESKRRRW